MNCDFKKLNKLWSDFSDVKINDYNMKFFEEFNHQFIKSF